MIIIKKKNSAFIISRNTGVGSICDIDRDRERERESAVVIIINAARREISRIRDELPSNGVDGKIQTVATE